MKRLLLSSIILGITSVLAIGATTAYFSDTEVSAGNTFTAGTLDLKLDNGDVNVTKFTLAGMKPGGQQRGTFRFNNAGSLPGKLVLSDVTITDIENARIEPEIKANDTTYEVGELSLVVNLTVFHDLNGNGSCNTEDIIVFNGKVNTLSAPLTLINNISAGGTGDIVFVFNWENTLDDNLAQGDSTRLDLEFTLQQI